MSLYQPDLGYRPFIAIIEKARDIDFTDYATDSLAFNEQASYVMDNSDRTYPTIYLFTGIASSHPDIGTHNHIIFVHTEAEPRNSVFYIADSDMNDPEERGRVLLQVAKDWCGEYSDALLGYANLFNTSTHLKPVTNNHAGKTCVWIEYHYVADTHRRPMNGYAKDGDMKKMIFEDKAEAEGYIDHVYGGRYWLNYGELTRPTATIVAI